MKTAAAQLPTWQDIHNDVENGRFIGNFGGDNTVWHGLANLRAGQDIATVQSQRPPEEKIHPSLTALIENPATRECWSKISTLDPLGLISKRPTMAATEACLSIPELSNTSTSFTVDGTIVNENLTINCLKCAIDYVWNLPLLAATLQMDEHTLRKVIAKATSVPDLMDKTRNAYLPPLGGCCVYIFGDPKKLMNPLTEVAVRVHDECIGSDVFGSDICTCRPYLVFALQNCIQCAQRGGVGIVVYFRKEGRSLGEVTKFRVYNVRKSQSSGDTPENYFKSTESVAGIRDARFQDLMPDVLRWLGIRRIDWLLSMSSEKYEAITKSGITVMQRVSLPEDNVSPNALVEITAKIASGYHSTSAMCSGNLIEELQSLEAIRARCQKIFALAMKNQSVHFQLHMENLPACTKYVMEVTQKMYGGFENVPYHSRWRHFDSHHIDKMKAEWHCSEKEKIRRLIDLVTVSVFMDAGAGGGWKYFDSDGHVQSRSEGLAIATFEMFQDGMFSSDPAIPHRVNALGIRQVTLKQFAKSLQVSDNNPIVGLENRFELLQKMANCFNTHPEYFGREVQRPGHILDYLISHSTTINVDQKAAESKYEEGNAKSTKPARRYRIGIKHLWNAIIIGFEKMWTTHDLRRGDIGIYSPLKSIGEQGSDLIPFHKLSQWLAYSLIEPLEEFGFEFEDMHLLTALAEYRNGGLLIDTHVLTPRSPQLTQLVLDVGCEAIVEWRALTICLIDLIWEQICSELKLTKKQLLLSKVLQGGTWNAGRLIAAENRHDRTAPLQVRSDATIF